MSSGFEALIALALVYVDFRHCVSHLLGEMMYHCTTSDPKHTQNAKLFLDDFLGEQDVVDVRVVRAGDDGE